MMKNKINKITNLTPKLIIIFLYIQPLLDILAAYLIKNNMPNYITSLIRIAFMLYLTLYLFITSYPNKKKTCIYITLLITTILIHTMILYTYKGPQSLSYEIRNTLSTYYFVFLLISFIIIYKDKNFNKKHLKNIFYIYIVLTFIPNILGFSYKSYDYSKIGSVGLFYSANVLGSILLLLLSTILLELKKLKTIHKILISLVTLYVIFTIGTKVPVLGLLIIIGANLLYIIYKLIKQKNKKILTIITIVLIIASTSLIIILPRANFYKNINIRLDYLKENNVEIKSLKFIDHFIFSSRFEKEKKTREYYESSHTLEKIFGIGYIEKRDNINEYQMIEIDYFDIFYREGIIGFTLYFIPLIYILRKNTQNIKLTLNGINKLTGIILILSIAFFQGHILVTPAISIYVALILVINCINNKESV